MGQRIRHYRQRKGVTQERLAELAGVSVSFMGHIERGSRIASLDTLMRLCAVLEVTPNDLLGVSDAPKASPLPDVVTLSPAELLENIALLLRMQEKP